MPFFGKKTPYRLTILPHPELCPEGDIVPAEPGRSVAEMLLRNRIEIPHSCQLQCACATCHVHIMAGAECLCPMDADEKRMLLNAQSRDVFSRLACQAVFQGSGDVVVEIP